MQSDKEKESASLLLLLGSALLRPCLGKPGTPRHQLHVWQVAAGSQCQPLECKMTTNPKNL